MVGGLVEEGEELVILLLADRVVLVAVALGTAHRQSHPDLGGRVDAVLDGRDAELLVVGPTLVVGQGVAMECGRQELVLGGAGQQVAGQLLRGETVVGHVGVERVDHPVAIAPDRPRQVLLVALGVGVPGQVEPHPRPPLAVGRGSEEPVHQPLVGDGAGVLEELRRPSRGWGEGR